MSLLGDLFERLRGLLPGGGEAAGEPPEATAAGYECAVCGTAVESPDAACPLCRSEDVVPAGGDGAGARRDGLHGRGPAESVSAGEDHTIGEVLSGKDPLSAYADRWERVDGGYRVTLPDGEARVASKDEVRLALFRNYGPPEE